MSNNFFALHNYSNYHARYDQAIIMPDENFSVLAYKLLYARSVPGRKMLVDSNFKPGGGAL